MGSASDIIPDDALANAKSAAPGGVSDIIPASALRGAVGGDDTEAKSITGWQHLGSAVDIFMRHPPWKTGIGMAENAVSGVSGGAGQLADAAALGSRFPFIGTGSSDAGSHDWAYQPRTEAGKELAAEAGVESSHFLNKLPDTPLGQTLKERIPEAIGAVGTVGALGGMPRIFRGGPEAPAVSAATTSSDLSLVPALRRTQGQPGMGTAAGTETGPPVSDATPRPSASMDLSVEPSLPRSAPGGEADTLSAAQPPLTASGLPRGRLWDPTDIPSRPGTGIDSEPVSGGLPTEAQASRAAILQRVGLTNARDSAVRGDAMSAATDAQLTKFDEPAGEAAKQQFDAEKAALQQHAQGIIERAGGTIGSDEDSLNLRGQTMAAPFDSLRQWFDTQRQKLYSAADERAAGAPISNLESVDEILQDPKFRNTLLARDQGGLLNSVENQMKEFRKQNPDGFTAQGAEQVRQWLNQIWTHDNRFAVGQLKGAIDDDVMKGAGGDMYGPARAFSRLKSQTLDDPNGIAQLFDKDPTTPLNRVTPFVKIPDTLTRLDPEQFRNVLRTLHEMPTELQPEAQAAIGEIKGHLVNKLLDAGMPKSPEGQWNAPNVTQAIRKNSSKLDIAFGNDAQAVQDIRDLQSAGNILRANPSYPGAAAQAANALKRGMMTRALHIVGSSTGAGIGAAVTGGPWGASAGGALGEMAASKASRSLGERAALKRWEERTTKLSDFARQ